MHSAFYFVRVGPSWHAWSDPVLYVFLRFLCVQSVVCCLIRIHDIGVESRQRLLPFESHLLCFGKKVSHHIPICHHANFRPIGT